MIVLLDTSQELGECAEELGLPVGQLITPLTRFANRGGKFAIDNGAFSGLRVSDFESLLEREKPNRENCLFVTVPDVVCSARRTLEVYWRWHERICVMGYRRALAIQNGVHELEIPWDEVDAVFIGGDDGFKTSTHSEHVIRAAQALRKWVHVGRVNDPARYAWCERLGVDSIDGSGISRYSHMRKALTGKLSQTPMEFDAALERGQVQ